MFNHAQNADGGATHYVFVYGTLMPGEANWPILAEHLKGPVRRAAMDGTRIYDTGWGFPALLILPGATRGWVAPISVVGLAELDVLEGVPHLYRRALLTTRDGARVWTYVWNAGTAGLSRHPNGWARHGAGPTTKTAI